MRQDTLPVSGMSCEHCERTVVAALGALPGVSSVEASHTQGRVVVRYDESVASIEAIEAAIVEAGYTVDR